MRSIDAVFELSDVDAIGNSYNNVVRSSNLLMEWTEERIYRSASSMVPKGMAPPYMLNQLLSAGSRFMPNGRERQTIICATLCVWEEPFEVLDANSVTITSVAEELKRTLHTDPFLKDGGSVKTERLDSFELLSYEGEQVDKEERVTLYVAFKAVYLVDINYLSRSKQ